MKTQFIRLEKYDDIISVGDKLGWSKTTRVVLVLPPAGGKLHRKLDLVMLLRQAKSLGIQIALVTRNQEIRQNAADLGLPVFLSVHQAQQKTWRRLYPVTPQRRERLVSISELKNQAKKLEFSEMSRTARLGVFSMAVLPVLILLVLFFPSAKVTIRPERLQQELTFEITANPRLQSANLSGGMPVHVETVLVETKLQKNPTGVVTIPEDKAAGVVEFINMTEEAVLIPAGTVVRTINDSTIKFTIDEKVFVPKGVGETASVKAIAVQGGLTGNVDAGEIQAVEGQVGLSVSVQNPMPFSGGTDRITSTPTQGDISAARKEIMDILWVNAQTEFTQLLEDGDLLISESIQLIKVIEETITPPVGSPSDQFEVSMRVQYEGYILKHEDINRIAVLVLDAAFPEGKAGIEGEISITPVAKAVSVGEQIYSWSLLLKRSCIPRVNRDQITSSLIRKPRAKSSDIIQEIVKLETVPENQTAPGGWQWMPCFPFRLHLEVE